MEREGLKTLIVLLEDKIASDNLNWKIMLRLVQTLFVLCFRD